MLGARAQCMPKPHATNSSVSADSAQVLQRSIGWLGAGAVSGRLARLAALISAARSSAERGASEILCRVGLGSGFGNGSALVVLEPLASSDGCAICRRLSLALASLVATVVVETGAFAVDTRPPRCAAERTAAEWEGAAATGPGAAGAISCRSRSRWRLSRAYAICLASSSCRWPSFEAGRVLDATGPSVDSGGPDVPVFSRPPTSPHDLARCGRAPGPARELPAAAVAGRSTARVRWSPPPRSVVARATPGA